MVVITAPAGLIATTTPVERSEGDRTVVITTSTTVEPLERIAISGFPPSTPLPDEYSRHLCAGLFKHALVTHEGAGKHPGDVSQHPAEGANDALAFHALLDQAQFKRGLDQLRGNRLGIAGGDEGADQRAVDIRRWACLQLWLFSSP